MICAIPDLRRIVLSKGLTTIESETFVSCQKLTNITLPEGIVRIEDKAFNGCDLTKVTFPSTLLYLGHEVFNTITTSVTLPAHTVIEIDSFSYAQSHGLKIIRKD